MLFGLSPQGRAYVVVDRIYSLIQKKTGFNPGGQIESITGLHVRECRFAGTKYPVRDSDLGRCLFLALLDYDKTGQHRPIDIDWKSTQSGKEFSSQLNWSLVDYQMERGSWKRYVPTNYLVYRFGELKILIDYYLMNKITIQFSERLEAEDFKFPESVRASQLLNSLRPDRLELQTFSATAQKTLSGSLELFDGERDLLYLSFKTDWNASSKEPLRVRVRGRLSPTVSENQARGME